MLERRKCGLMVLTLGLVVATVKAAEASESADESIRRCLELLRAGEIELARAHFAPDSLPEHADELLHQAHEALQVGDSVEFRVVNRTVSYVTEGGRIDTLVYHARGEAKALLVLAQLRETDDARALIGLRWELAPMNLSERYPFTFSGVPVLYFVLLGLAVVVPAFMLYAAVVCFQQKQRRRWLWLLFILCGLGKLSVVWVPGPLNPEYIRISPFSIQLLGAGIKKMPIYEPWVLSISLPVGAALFLLHQRARRRAKEGTLAARADADNEPVPTDS